MGPATCLRFLGIEIDSVNMVLRLPEEKLAVLRQLVTSWKDRHSCRKVELQSLAGKLQHACKVVRPGRSFLRCIFELLEGTHHRHHHIRMNQAMRSNLAWWDAFLESWNGVSMLLSVQMSTPQHHAFSDATGAFGAGAIWVHQWLQKIEVASGGNSTKEMYTHCVSLHGVGAQLEGCSGTSPL